MLRRSAWILVVFACLFCLTSTAFAETGVVNLPAALTVIDDQAFYTVCEIHEAVLPDGVVEIGSEAFAYSGLERINLPDSITRIADNAFDGCTHVAPTFESTTSYAFNWWVKRFGLFKYQLREDETAEITGILRTEGELPPIPAEVAGFPVVAIADNAFSGCRNLTGTLVIPDSVTSIGEAAFEGCDGLTGDLVIPAGVTVIKPYAFYGSGFDGRLVLPTGLVSIGQDAFSQCGELTGDLVIPEGVVSIDDEAFFGCTGFDGCLVLPDTLKVIGNNAFDACRNLSGSLMLPEGLTTIQSSAFCGCTGLTGDLVIPDSVTSLGSFAFAYCDGLNNTVTLSRSLTEIPSMAFAGNYALQMVYLPASITHIADDAFDGCTRLYATFESEDSYAYTWWKEHMSKPVSIEQVELFTEHPTVGSAMIWDIYFSGDFAPFSFTFTVYADDVAVLTASADEGYFEYVPERAGTYRLHVRMEDSAGNVSEADSEPCTVADSMTDGTFVFSMKEDGTLSIIGCTLTEGELPVIPDSFNGLEVTEIAGDAFAANRNLTGSLVLPRSLTTIGAYAFEGCSNLTGQLVIPNRVTSIGDYAFAGCSGFTGELTLSSKLESIGWNAFTSCTGIRKVYLPASLTYINPGAFWQCDDLHPVFESTDSYAYTWWDENIGFEHMPFPESAHPYTNNTDETLTWRSDRELLGITIHFAPETETYDPNDYITIYDGNGWEFDRGFGTQFADTSITIWYCNEFSIRLTTDGSKTSYGYRIDSIEEIPYPPFAIQEFILATPNATVGDELQWYVWHNNDHQGPFQYEYTLYIDDEVADVEVRTATDTLYTYVATRPGMYRLHVRVEDRHGNVAEGDSEAYKVGERLTDGNFNYFLKDDGTVMVSKCLVQEGECPAIPSTFDGYTVNEIGYMAFNWLSDLTGTLTLPDTITVIDDGAFTGCSGLTGQLVLPKNLTYLGNSAFYGCSGFTGDLVIPDVENSFDFAFMNCSGFDGTLTLPAGLTQVGKDVFENCTGFTGSLVLPEGVTVVSDSAFHNCGFDGTLTLPETLTTIEAGAFQGCSFTGDLTIPDSVTFLGANAFSDCGGFNGKLTLSHGLETIPEWAFQSMGFTGDLIIPDGVKTIGFGAFVDCMGFNGNLVIGDTVTSIEPRAFSDCGNLSGSLTLSKNLESIGYSAFSFCGNLSGSLVLPDGLKTIGEYAFSYCRSLTGDLIIPDSVTQIDDAAFYICDGFNGRLVLSNSLTEISERAFDGTSGLTGNLVIPGSVTTIGRNAFSSTGIESFYFPDSVTHIDSTMLEECGEKMATFESEDSYAAKWWAGKYGIPGAVYLESAHPYANDMDDYFTWQGRPEALGHRIHFSADTVTEPGCDFIIIINSDGEEVGWYSGWELTNRSIDVMGSGFTIHMLSDSSVTEYGFCIDGIAELEPEPVTIDGFWPNSFTGLLGVPVTWRAEVYGNLKPFTYTYTLIDCNTGSDILTAVSDTNKFTWTPETMGSYMVKLHVEDNAGNVFDVQSAPVDVTEFDTNRLFDYSMLPDGTVEIVHYHEGMTELWPIPSVINGYTVTRIGDSAFNSRQNLTGKLVIPDTITSIGEYAFAWSPLITGDLIIPDSVTEIGQGAFSGCTGFDGQLVLSDGLTVIPQSAFDSCSGLTGNLVLPSNLVKIGPYAFSHCSGLTGSLVFPETLRTVEYYAFTDCDSLGSDLTIPGHVEFIGDRAFGDCDQMNGELIISSGVQYIDSYAFANSNFQSVYLPDSLTYIGEGAFAYGSSEPRKVTFESNSSYAHNWWVENNGFVPGDVFLESSHPYADNTDETKTWQGTPGAFGHVIHFSEQCWTENDYDFIEVYDGFGNLSAHLSGDFGNSYIMVRGDSFSVRLSSDAGVHGYGYCIDSVVEATPEPVSVTEVCIFDESPVVGREVCCNPMCAGNIYPLTFTYTLYANGEIVETSAPTTNACYFFTPQFVGTYMLHVRVEDDYGNVSEGDSAPVEVREASTDDMFNYILLEDGTAEITGCNFSVGSFSAIPSVINGYTVTSIGDYAFDFNEQLVGTLQLPETLKHIGYSSFMNCLGLTGDLMIPDSVTEIGDWAFRQCHNLDGQLILPQGLTCIGEDAFCWCENLSGELVIPDSVTEIGRGAFGECECLTGVQLSKNLTVINDSTFMNCRGLTGTFVIPEGVKKLGYEAFFDCSGVQCFHFPASLEFIPEDIFYSCTADATFADENSFAANWWRAHYGSDKTYLESAHPYAPNTDETLTWYGNPDAIGHRVHFSREASIREGVDSITILDGYGNVVYTFMYINEFFNEAHYIPGGSFSVRLISGDADPNGEHFGYRVDGVVETPPEPVRIHGCWEQGGSEHFAGRAVQWRISVSGNLPPYTYTCQFYRYNPGYDYELVDTITSDSDIITYTFDTVGQYKIEITVEDQRGNTDSWYNWFDVIEFDENHLFTYRVQEDGTAAITGYTRAMNELLPIPQEIDGYTVTRIDELAFSWRDDLTGQIIIPDTVTSIGDSAFAGCIGLDGSLTLPTNLTEIGIYAFSDCVSLTGDLILPDSIVTIGERAFENCNSLNGRLVLPANLTEITQSCFEGCTSLTGDLILPNSIVTIGQDAFNGCGGMTGRLVLPANLTEIASHAFGACKFTGSLVLPEKLTTLGAYCFNSCDGFDGNLVFPDGLITLGDSCFRFCSGFTGDLTLPDSVQSIEPFAFQMCSGFNGQLKLPSQIKIINEQAFRGLTNLTGTLVIPSGVETIADGAFSEIGVEQVYLPDSVTFIGDFGFGGGAFNAAPTFESDTSYAAQWWAEHLGMPI